MKLKVSLLAMALVALVSLGSAQQDQGGGGQGGGGRRQGMRGGMDMMGGQRLVQLLRNPQVQEELKLTDDEKAKIEDLPRPQRGGGGGGGAPTTPSMEEQTKQFADDKAATSAILTAEQEKRLEELRIQWAGPSAVYLPDVQAGLALTDDQKAKLTTLRTQMMDAMRKMREEAQDGGDRQAMMEKMRGMQDTLKTEVDKVLTDDQKTKLKAMGGAELKQERVRRGGGRN